MSIKLVDRSLLVERAGEDPTEHLKRIIMTTKDLPAMPQVATKVLELSSDPRTSASQLQQVISDDQAMTGRILKIANSAMYSCSRKIKTLTEAIVMLGLNSIRSLVVTSAARNLYNTRNSTPGLKERLLWEHSIGTALGCRHLIKDRLPGLQEEAFLAGLMHDIGKLVLNLQMPESFDEIVQVVYNENQAFPRVERRMLGFDHAQVGALLVNKWNLSPALEKVIACHHDPASFTADNPLLLHLDLANQLARKLGIGFLEDPGLDVAGSLSNQLLGLPEQKFEETAVVLRETLESEMEIFI